MIVNLIKSVVAATVVPVAIISDIVILPATAYENKHPFEKTKLMLKISDDNLKKALD